MGKRVRVPYQATAPGLVTSRHTHIIDAAHHPIWQEAKEGCYTPSDQAAGDPPALEEGSQEDSQMGVDEGCGDQAGPGPE